MPASPKSQIELLTAYRMPSLLPADFLPHLNEPRPALETMINSKKESMFSELLPLLTERTLFLTVARVDDSHIRVNVIPKRLKENDTGENALTTPLSITGTAEELDRELSVQLSGFVESLNQTSCNLAQLQEIHKSAVKAVEAENKKNLDSKRKVDTSQTPSKDEKPTGGPVFKDGKPVFGSKNASVKETKGLFEEVSPTSSNGGRPEVASGTPVNETSASGSSVQHQDVMPEQLLDSSGLTADLANQGSSSAIRK